MGWWLLLAVFLYLACAVLIIAEVLLPSGGLLSICALACLAGGFIIFFQHSTAAAYVGVILAFVMIPTVLILAYKVFPKTRFGNSTHLSPSERSPGDASPGSDELTELLGADGIAFTPMHPVGMVKFNDRRVECVAESGYIEKDTEVKVIRVQGSRVTVRAVETG